MATIVIEDAFYPCCDKKFRDKTELRAHQLADLANHRPVIERVIRQHDAMWNILKKEGTALKMRANIDGLSGPTPDPERGERPK